MRRPRTNVVINPQSITQFKTSSQKVAESSTSQKAVRSPQKFKRKLSGSDDELDFLSSDRDGDSDESLTVLTPSEPVTVPVRFMLYSLCSLINCFTFSLRKSLLR